MNDIKCNYHFQLALASHNSMSVWRRKGKGGAGFPEMTNERSYNGCKTEKKSISNVVLYF